MQKRFTTPRFFKKNLGGFTLIEMMVAVSIFVFIVTAGSGIFISSLRVQRQGLASQQLLDQTSYVIEYMSRALRMAKKDLDGDCISAKLNYEETRAGKGLAFKNYNNICQEFYWDDINNDQLKEVVGDTENFLTSNDLEIISFNINLSGKSQLDDIQPRVTLSLEIKGEEQSNIKIQTTVSQRNIDINQ